MPSPGDPIDPSLPAQFTGADLDLGAIGAAVDGSIPGNVWVVNFAFTEAAAGQFETWSGQHVNDFFAIVLDGKVLSVPYIKTQITGGRGMISGDYTAERAQELAAVLQSGWLPFPLREVSLSGDAGAGVTAIASPATTIPPEIVTSGRTIGDPNAPVTLDVWLDYQCPGCRVFYQESLPVLISTYVEPGKLRIVNHDLLVIDSNVGGHESLDAANAARCAADQGKFATSGLAARQPGPGGKWRVQHCAIGGDGRRRRAGHDEFRHVRGERHSRFRGAGGIVIRPSIGRGRAGHPDRRIPGAHLFVRGHKSGHRLGARRNPAAERDTALGSPYTGADEPARVPNRDPHPRLADSGYLVDCGPVADCGPIADPGRLRRSVGLRPLQEGGAFGSYRRGSQQSIHVRRDGRHAIGAAEPRPEQRPWRPCTAR